MSKNKPKINGKRFLKALNKIREVLYRKTFNEMNNAERDIVDIVGDELAYAYLTKGN